VVLDPDIKGIVSFKKCHWMFGYTT